MKVSQKNMKNSILTEPEGIKCQTSKEITAPAWQKLKQKCRKNNRNVKKCMGSRRIEIHFIKTGGVQCIT